MSHPTQFSEVTVDTKANIYFDGGVISHSVRFSDGSRKTLGIIRAGSYSFGTEAAEHMAILDGHCRWRMSGETEWNAVEAGGAFNIPANSRFDIAVDEGQAQYICSFLP